MATRILIMGLPGAGKTYMAEALRQRLWEEGRTVTWFNADQVRQQYNDWDFTPALVQRYLHAMERARVPIVELGFRTIERGGYLGATAFTTDRYLEELELPASAQMGVMVNAKELATHQSAHVVDQLFAPRSQSPVEWVRLAAHFGELAHIGEGVLRLRELDLEPFLLGLRLNAVLEQLAIALLARGRASPGLDHLEQHVDMAREQAVSRQRLLVEVGEERSLTLRHRGEEQMDGQGLRYAIRDGGEHQARHRAPGETQRREIRIRDERDPLLEEAAQRAVQHLGFGRIHRSRPACGDCQR